MHYLNALFIYCLECQLQKDIDFVCLGPCCIPDAWYTVGDQRLLNERMNV